MIERCDWRLSVTDWRKPAVRSLRVRIGTVAGTRQAPASARELPGQKFMMNRQRWAKGVWNFPPVNQVMGLYQYGSVLPRVRSKYVG
jgi:hypothetical protein